MVGGDYALPAHRASAEADQAAERKAAAEAAEKRQKAEEKRREALMKAAFSDLESAVRGNDTAGVARAIDQVRRDDYGEFWRASLHAASREAQLVLLREMHYSRLRSLLEEPEIDPEVRHRLAVITMKEHSGGPVRKMGALRDVSTHDLLVWVVADAIGDRINARGGK